MNQEKISNLLLNSLWNVKNREDSTKIETIEKSDDLNSEIYEDFDIDQVFNEFKSQFSENNEEENQKGEILFDFIFEKINNIHLKRKLFLLENIVKSVDNNEACDLIQFLENIKMKDNLLKENFGRNKKEKKNRINQLKNLKTNQKFPKN